MAATPKLCSCGRRMSKHSTTCTRCHDQRMEELCMQARAIVAKGCCPTCGSGLQRNLSLTGWWQCEQYGAPQYRKDPTKDGCSFQTFTDLPGGVGSERRKRQAARRTRARS